MLRGASAGGKKIAAETVLDFDDPQVAVELDLTFQTLLDGGGINPFLAMNAREAAIAIVADFCLRRRSEQRGSSIESVENDKNRPGFGRATAPEHGDRTDGLRPPDQGRNENVGAQPHVIAPRGRTVSPTPA